MADRDKRSMIFPIKRLADLGFQIQATKGTAEVLRRHGVEAVAVRKASEGSGPNGEPTIVDEILDRKVDLVINTPHGIGSRNDGYKIRTAAVLRGTPVITTSAAVAAVVQAIEVAITDSMSVNSLQEYAARINVARSAGV
jgi:carbamoyl-phosphate synthase large subunit